MFITGKDETHNFKKLLLEWNAIGVWAWGASRALDYLKQDELTRNSKVIMFRDRTMEGQLRLLYLTMTLTIHYELDRYNRKTNHFSREERQL